MVLSLRTIEVALPLLLSALGLGMMSPAIAADSPPGSPPLSTLSLTELLTPPILSDLESISPATPPNGRSPDPVRPPSVEKPMSLLLSLRTKRVTLYRGSEKIVSYPVAIGRPGWETPVGKFQVFDMIKNPIWEHPWAGKLVPPGPNNPLGDRWISFWSDGKNSIGFHGTTNENLIGQAVSHGCVRMKNQDIRALFEKVKVGTLVIVEP